MGEKQVARSVREYMASFIAKEFPMPFCPVCKYEYEEGVCRCPDCDVDLVNQLPVEEPEIPVVSPDDELTYAILSDKPLEVSAQKGMMNKPGAAIFSSPIMIVIAGVILYYMLQPLLLGLCIMIGVDFRHDMNSISTRIVIIFVMLIPIFIMGLAMGRFAPQRSVRTAFLTGLVLTLSISAMGTLIVYLIPHRGMSGTYTSQDWVLWVVEMIVWQLVQAGIFLAGFLAVRKRQCPEAFD